MKRSPPSELEDLVRGLLRPGRVSVLGLSGQTGAGKTLVAAPLLLAIAERAGFPAARLGLDAFFRMSTAERTAWLAEGAAMGPEEESRRRYEFMWWNFALAEESLSLLRDGKPLHLRQVYNREDAGRLSGRVDIVPPAQGMLVLLEGVAIAHLQGLDKLVYVHAPARERLANLIGRDRHRDAQENLERLRLSEEFEQKYFLEHFERIDLFVRLASPAHPRTNVVDPREVAASLSARAELAPT
jgi:uridine kinase